MTDEKTAAPSAFAFLAEQRPDFALAFRNYLGAAYRPENAVLPEQSRVLVFLVLLAAAGSLDSFRTHLADGVKAGLSRAEIVEALMLVAPIFGYQRVLAVITELKDYPDPA